MSIHSTSPVVVGVDVGGSKKGFHAVAMQASKVLDKLVTCDTAAVVDWCRSVNASIVGIDAPCKWSRTGRRRPCECELAGLGISAFSTPSLAIGQVHPFYGWMLNVAELFRQLAPHYLLYEGRTPARDHVCFETFPHAIACALAGQILSAKNKRIDRIRLLDESGIPICSLKNIDEVDAALCALTTYHFLAGTFKAYGDETEGHIVVPSVPMSRH